MIYYDIDDFIKSLNPWNVFLFHHDLVHSLKPHYSVILTDNLWFNKFIVFSIATSNVDDRIMWIKRTWLDSNTLVIIEEWEVPFFSKRTCFNCNDVKEFLVDEIYWKYLKWTLKPIWNLNTTILRKIINWVLISDLVPEYMKDKIIKSKKNK